MFEIIDDQSWVSFPGTFTQTISGCMKVNHAQFYKTFSKQWGLVMRDIGEVSEVSLEWQ